VVLPSPKRGQVHDACSCCAAAAAEAALPDLASEVRNRCAATMAWAAVSPGRLAKAAAAPQVEAVAAPQVEAVAVPQVEGQEGVNPLGKRRRRCRMQLRCGQNCDVGGRCEAAAAAHRGEFGDQKEMAAVAAAALKMPPCLRSR
jgi:hypothetical protein